MRNFIRLPKIDPSPAMRDQNDIQLENQSFEIATNCRPFSCHPDEGGI